MSYQHFGLVAFIILVLGLTFVLLKWPQSKQLTFSQHVALHKSAILYYIALFSVVLPLLLLFFLNWFVPTFQLPVWFTVFVVASAVAQYLATLIPEVGGWKTQYHQSLAGISAICLLPPLLMLIISPSVASAAKLITALCLSLMIGIIYLVAKGRGKHSHFLILQATYFAAFFSAILFVNYTS